MHIAPDAADPPTSDEPTNPCAGLTPAQQVEESLCDACAAALVLAERVALWHFAGRPTIFDGTEPELHTAMVAMADRLLSHGPVAAARTRVATASKPSKVNCVASTPLTLLSPLQGAPPTR